MRRWLLLSLRGRLLLLELRLLELQLLPVRELLEHLWRRLVGDGRQLRRRIVHEELRRLLLLHRRIVPSRRLIRRLRQ